MTLNELLGSLDPAKKSGRESEMIELWLDRPVTVAVDGRTFDVVDVALWLGGGPVELKLTEA